MQVNWTWSLHPPAALRKSEKTVCDRNCSMDNNNSMQNIIFQRKDFWRLPSCRVIYSISPSHLSVTTEVCSLYLRRDAKNTSCSFPFLALMSLAFTVAPKFSLFPAAGVRPRKTMEQTLFTTTSIFSKKKIQITSKTPITEGNPQKKLYHRIRHIHISKVLLLQI